MIASDGFVEEIAEAVGMEQRSVGQVLEKTADLPKSLKPYAEHLIDFEMLTEGYTKKNRKDI